MEIGMDFGDGRYSREWQSGMELCQRCIGDRYLTSGQLAICVFTSCASTTRFTV